MRALCLRNPPSLIPGYDPALSQEVSTYNYIVEADLVLKDTYPEGYGSIHDDSRLRAQTNINGA